MLQGVIYKTLRLISQLRHRGAEGPVNSIDELVAAIRLVNDGECYTSLTVTD